jgi:hypothetical protein
MQTEDYSQQALQGGSIMKIATCVAIAVAVLAGAALAQPPTAARPAKHSESTGEPTYEGRIEGDTIEECWTIPSLPFTGTGNTCAYANDYDEVCPYAGSTAPDVVYAYEPPYDMCVSISLCDSYYDTKVYVYEDVVGNVPIDGCNDDNLNCVDPPVSYTSWIESVEIFAGHVYYIVVDGYYAACGDYVLYMEEVECPVPCDVICVGVPEGEPTCYDDYVDNYNGGCNSDPNIFSIQPLGNTTVCGESGVYSFGTSTYRDTDWYLLSPYFYPCGDVPVSITVEAEFGVIFGFVEGVPECIAPAFYSYTTAAECTPTTLTEYLPCVPIAIFVSTDSWDPAYSCGLEYSLTVEGYGDSTPVENMS